MTVQRSKGTPRAYPTRPDEAPWPPEQRTDTDPGCRGPGGRVGPGNRLGAVPHVSLTRCAALTGSEPADPVYRRFLRAAAQYRKARCRELATMGGGTCGVGVSGLVASASYALADARYLRHLATMEPVPRERAALLVQAGRLEANAKTAEIAAYELQVREAAARPKPDAIAALVARLAAPPAGPEATS